ncbi:unnamed protein product [Colias eurytheme]|nr:unnamed protein product [Colias eurytheme]
MLRPKPQWQLQALAAQKRDNELRRAEELKKWTTEGYYEKAKREAELLSERKIRAAQLEERRKKLELMLFQENMQYQQELKALAAQPKFFKNGSYLNKVPTSTLQEINQGIMEKEEQLRKQEAELKLYHAWRLRQPELRAASSYMANGKLKSAWLEQIVEKEVQKKKDDEETRKILQERDEALQKQIQLEEQRLREKELQMRELRSGLEEQIAELSEKETAVKKLRTFEEKERMILDELQFISNEREREHLKLVAERDTSIINMGLHKFKLKKKVLSVLNEISLDLKMLERIKRAIIKARDRNRAERERESSVEREIRRSRDRDRHTVQRDRESSVEREARLSQLRDRYRSERERESSVEREVHRSRDRERHQIQRARES